MLEMIRQNRKLLFDQDFKYAATGLETSKFRPVHVLEIVGREKGVLESRKVSIHEK